MVQLTVAVSQCASINQERSILGKDAPTKLSEMGYLRLRGGRADTCRCISKADAEDAIEISGIRKARAARDVGHLESATVRSVNSRCDSTRRRSRTCS